jgi:hypothetical protein
VQEFEASVGQRFKQGKSDNAEYYTHMTWLHLKCHLKEFLKLGTIGSLTVCTDMKPICTRNSIAKQEVSLPDFFSSWSWLMLQYLDHALKMHTDIMD